jgi:hypothetical protein
VSIWRSEQSIGRDAAQQGLGMPTNASPAAQDAYHREMARRNRAPLVPGFSIPRPSIDAGGLGFLLLVPVFVAYWLVMDLVTGWRWWRVVAILAGVAVAGLAMALGIQAELAGGGWFDHVAARLGVTREDLVVNVGAGGVAGVLVFLFPRTFLILGILTAVGLAYDYLIAPLL